MDKSSHPDPFAVVRQSQGVSTINDQNDPVLMVLGHRDVRKCAHDWRTYSSGATPGRIVVPSEVNIRDTRQIPFEVDPPEHTEYRSLVEAWFRRPLEEAYGASLKKLINDAVDTAISSTSVEVVTEFALPLQSHALTLLLNVDGREAEEWIGWGTHVFRSEDNPLDNSKANLLYEYIDRQIEKAAAQPDDSLYSLLLGADFQGRKMTREEIRGVMILTFAGGRDTVINAVTNTIAYFAEHPDSLTRIREEPEITGKAVEELIRYFAPLTHMGRVATKDTTVCEHAVEADSRISLCWASANRDERVFERPNEVVLDRKMNPHLSFGFGTHNCLGATHARELLKSLVTTLAEKVGTIDLGNLSENMEEWGAFDRKVGYHFLNASFAGW